jgi:hypothetical protein
VRATEHRGTKAMEPTSPARVRSPSSPRMRSSPRDSLPSPER